MFSCGKKEDNLPLSNEKKKEYFDKQKEEIIKELEANLSTQVLAKYITKNFSYKDSSKNVEVDYNGDLSSLQNLSEHLPKILQVLKKPDQVSIITPSEIEFIELYNLGHHMPRVFFVLIDNRWFIKSISLLPPSGDENAPPGHYGEEP